MNKTQYEWIAEILDEHEDVVETRGAETLRELAPTREEQVALCKSVGDELSGLGYRTWAYLTNGKVPEVFDDGTPVPKKFQQTKA